LVEPIHPTPSEFFASFVQKNANINQILLECHPTLLDCKKIFSKDYYQKCFEIYCKVYMSFLEGPIESLYPENKYFRITESTTTGIFSGDDDVPGGMVDAVKHGIFNYNIRFYEVKFLESEDSKYGIRYFPFCYVNERWVFIPKPYFSEFLKVAFKS